MVEFRDTSGNGGKRARPNVGRGRLRGFADRFARDEDGTFIIFGMYIFIVMLVMGGMAVDFMHHENQRTKLQNTLDRAVLAAADLDQTLDPTSVVQDYFEKAGVSQYLGDISVDQGINFRTVSAEAEVEVDTMFLGMLGIDQIETAAAGGAEERVANVEISVVLDISGSMRYNSKMANLRYAGAEFIDTVLKPETEDLISVSLVPYTAQVNAGPLITSKLNYNQVHGYSHCVEFDEPDFNDASISLGRVWQQSQHFEWSSASSFWITNPGCPQQAFERIVPYSQDATQLKNTINQYRDRANTAIHIGMKWGAGLLDPEFQPIVTQLIGESEVDGVFAGRPAEYDDPETLKTIVVMTDGQNVDTYRIQDWAYDSPNERAHWDRFPLWKFLYQIPSSDRSEFYYRRFTAGQADLMLDHICDAAKAEGVVIWSIGFEVGNHGASVMKNCASTPSHFFRVEGSEISDAFRAIARQINQLRLTL